MKNFKTTLRVYLLPLIAVLMLGTISFAQETSGEIQGTVKDAQGAVIPNATVTIKGVDVGITRTAQTDSAGYFRIRQLPPGAYNVSTAAISGFAAQTKEQVQVALGNATTIDFELSTSSVQATVDVTTDSGVTVDATETKAQDNISAREIDALPKGTGFSGLLKTTAAVRPEPAGGQFSINGSTGPENSFIIDGQETQNFKNGLLNVNNDIPYQALQEIQVKTSGFEAEFGGATGGVINGVTKSGSNQFRGEFGINFTTQKLNARLRDVATLQTLTSVVDTNQAFEYLPQQNDKGTGFFPTGIMSGPIIKDRLWFFAIHSPRITTTTRTTNFIQGFGATRAPATLSAALLAAGATTTQTATEKDIFNYSQLRLDASPFTNLRLSGSYTWNPIVQEGVLLGGTSSAGGAAGNVGNGLIGGSYVIGAPGSAPLGPNGSLVQGSALAAMQGGRQNSNNLRFEGIWTPTSKLVLLGRYTRGFLNQKLFSYGIPDEPRIICQNVPAAREAQAGCVQGFQTNRLNDLVKKDVSVRTTYDVQASYLFKALGGHELKGGYQRSSIFNDVDSGSVGPGRSYLYYNQPCFDPNFVYVQWNISPGNYTCPANSIGTGVNYQFGAFGNATNIADTLFVQDKWQPTSRLTFNLGLRVEQEKIPAFNQNTIDLKFKWADKLAPRLGVAYALTSDGKTKISAFYGRFFDRLKFSLPLGSFGGNFYHVSYFYITADRPGYQNYSVAQNKGNYNFPVGGQCPIASGSRYVCDQDLRIASNVVGANALENGAVDPNVKPYRQSEATIEFQREVTKSTVFTARYLWRNLDEAIEDSGVPTASGSEAYVIGNPGRGLAADVYSQLGYQKALRPVRNYKALQLEMDTRYIRNFNLNLNYTLSRLYGNYSGLASPDEFSLTTLLGRSTPNVNRDFDEPWVGFSANGSEALGVLGLDRTHVFKASGTYTFDWRGNKTNSTDVSFFTTAESGTPKTTFVTVMGIPIPETKRGDLGRTPVFTQTDLNFTHRYKFGRDDKFTLALDFNVLNVFNENNVLAVNQSKSSNSFSLSESAICATGPVCATNRLTSGGVLTQYAAAETTFGVLKARNVAFNQPYLFQDPRSVRFGFRLLF